MKEKLNVNLRNAGAFVSFEEVVALAKLSARHLDALNNGTGAGNDFLVERIKAHNHHQIVIPDEYTVNFKEAE